MNSAAVLRHVTPLLDRATPVLSHAAPLLTVRAPLIAGAGAAVLLVLTIAAIAVFGRADLNPPSALGGVEPAPPGSYTAAAPLRDDPRGATDTIEFIEPESGSEVSLEGVGEGFSSPAPAARTQPAVPETPPNPNALRQAPFAGLSEPGPGGLLPVIGPNGERVSRAYARPYHGDPNAPTIALVIGGMGLNRTVTEAAIAELPPEIALSFAAYTPDLQAWIDRARAAGHEVLIEAPMEPFDYPNNDPGPHTLLADGPRDENLRRLAWILSRATGYFGVTNYLGARFSASHDAMSDVLRELEGRGVAFLHDGAGRRSTIEAVATQTDIAYALADRILDVDPSPNAIDNRLLALEALALQNGAALGTGFAYPATVEQIQAWLDGLELRGYQLAPPSAVIARRRLEQRIAAQAETDATDPDAATNHRWADQGGADSGGGYDDGGH